MEYKENTKDYHPKMHSAEHILNGTMVKMFNRGRSFTQHIEKKKSKCDYRFDRDLTPAEIQSIEATVNSAIAADIKVVEEFMDREEAGKYFNLERLPEDAGDNLRVIRIGEYDVCLCSGQHVNSTGEIGEFKIASTNFENGVLRIRFKLQETS
jgi:alanyl-tRNA synthetase